MYGMGYGLGKMVEGATTGASQGMLQGMVWNREDKKRAEDLDYRNQTLDLQKKQFDATQLRLTKQDDIQKMQRTATTLKTAYDIASKAPNPEETFRAIYQTLDPAGEVPEVKIGENNMMEINFQGMKMKGSKAQILQAMELIKNNPERSPEIFYQLSNLGLANIEFPEPAKPNIMSPGSQMVDATGKVIHTAPAAPGKDQVYTKQQLVDDTRGYYTALMRALMDPMGGGVSRENEDKYNNIVNNMNKDLQLINQGQQPSWLTGALPVAPAAGDVETKAAPAAGEKQLDKKTALEILREARGDVKKAEIIAKRRGYKVE